MRPAADGGQGGEPCARAVGGDDLALTNRDAADRADEIAGVAVLGAGGGLCIHDLGGRMRAGGSMDHGDACDLADKALASGALRVELLLTDAVGEAEAAGVLRSGGYLLQRALAGTSGLLSLGKKYLFDWLSA